MAGVSEQMGDKIGLLLSALATIFGHSVVLSEIILSALKCVVRSPNLIICQTLLKLIGLTQKEDSHRTS